VRRLLVGRKKYVVTGSTDSTLLVWDAKAVLRRKREPIALTAAARASLWADLGKEDAAIGVPAIDSLVQAPEAALALVKQHVQPLSAAELARWVEDLDSNVFAQRDKAMRELARLEFAAAKALRGVLEGKPSLELRLRAEKLLKGLEEPIRSPQLLAAWRAVIILEQINTPEARDLLEALAKGAPEARLTRDAQAALQRLAAADGR
jgi:hypothetical protein